MRKHHTKDYSITLGDSTGRTIELFINGDCIDEAIEQGCSMDIACEQNETNKVENAIAEGLIGPDCYLVSTTFTKPAIKYSTGRTYDGPQVLEIEIENRQTDEFGLEEITATFRDSSRHIAGRVTAIVFNDGIGAAVLTEYDAGRYQAI
jgi:hypothetical protein